MANIFRLITDPKDLIEKQFRQREAKKTQLLESEIEEVSHETLMETMVSLCEETADVVVDCIVKKFEKAGYTASERN
ncbi:MAG: hypothetical protein NTY80_02290 [candidate division SR1 bacterium]|nr:hypothetical protein [candidate division SR1 bacterium]